MFTRIVRTGLARTVSTPAIAAAWTMCVAPRATSRERVGIEDVALDERQVRVLREVRAAERVAVEVVVGDDLVVVDEPPRERRADEAGAARDQDPLAAQSHAPSVVTARAAAAARYNRWMAILATFTAALLVTVWPQGAGGPSTSHRVVCPGAAVCAQLGRVGRAAFAPRAVGRRLHRDLRRPSAGARDGPSGGTRGLGAVQPRRRLPDRPLVAAAVRARARRVASATVKTILFVGAGRHQRARDPARAGARAARRRRRPQPRRARLRRGRRRRAGRLHRRRRR